MKGHVRERGKGNWYAVLSVRDPETGKRKVQWRSLPGCKGKKEAQIECSRLITEIADGSFVVSNQTTLAEWINHWLAIGAPGKKRKAVGRKTLERYGQLLRVHVIPALGNRSLQKVQSFTKLRSPKDVTDRFRIVAAKLGFKGLRLHDLRGTHETLLLDAGVPVHVVAARCGHDPAILLRSYAKRTRKADRSAAGVIGALSRGVLGQ
jgi:integrase